MTERQRFREACAENGRLARENGDLRTQVQHDAEQIAELEAANFNLQVERDSADVLLGAAMDEFQA